MSDRPSNGPLLAHRSTPLVSRIRAAVLCLCLVMAGMTLVNRPSPPVAYPSSTVALAGHGFGHGRGMGQFGALGYAIDEDRSASWILDHFYGGTTGGTQGDGEIAVQLLEQDGRDLIVTSGSSFTIGSNQFSAGTAGRVRRTGGTWAIDRAPGCGGPWEEAQPGIDGGQRPEARTGYGGDDVNQMIKVCASNVRSYRGSVHAVFADGAARGVNQVRMEQYLRGVVPRESPASWGDLDGGRGQEALKAQAVAARSYAWAENRSGFAKTCDSTACQVYQGAGVDGARIEFANTDRAIRDTAGQVRRLGTGAIARTEFSSSTGGWTAGGLFPAVADTGDDTASNRNHNWTASIDVGRMESAYPTIGTLTAVTVTERNGLGEDGGRVLRVRVEGTRGSTSVTGADFRAAFGLLSDWFRVVAPAQQPTTVGIAADPTGDGYWTVSSDGAVVPFGDADRHGDLRGTSLNRPVVGMASTPDGRGYWLVASDGGVFSFGTARFFGSMGGARLNQPVVGMASTRSGEGYWLVASDGGIFSFGDARFHGSTGGQRLNQPVVGMAAHPSGGGYWLVASDGGIFSFGDARFHGSTGGQRLNQPVVGMAAHPSGGGYWLVASDGGVFSFDVAFYGSAGGRAVPGPITGMATTTSGRGYWLAGSGGSVERFGDAAP